MTEISDSLRLLFETEIEADGDDYVVSIPAELVEGGSLSLDEAYRVALLDADSEEATGVNTGSSTASESSATETTSDAGGASRSRATASAGSRGRQTQEPPVSEGDIRTVTIDTLGDQGDGIAKVERGFIVIVPGTEPGDQLNVEITDVKETVAFAEPVGTADEV